MTGSPLRVILADDHQIVRDGLRMVLESAGNFEVVAEADTADDAVRYVRGHKPDILVLDLNMPGTPSLEMIPAISEASPDTRVVVLTMQSGTAFARQALRAGVCGYVLKESAGTELVHAIGTVVEGGTYLTPALGARLATEPEQPELPDALTPREAEVLSLLALGHTNAEIGDQLHLSRRTVETHRASLQSKTDCATRAELVRYAITHELLSTESD